MPLNLSINTYKDSILFKDLGQALRSLNYSKTVSKTERIVEVIFNRYRLHFKGPCGIQQLQQSMPKFIAKLDAIWDATFFLNGRAQTAQARAMETVPCRARERRIHDVCGDNQPRALFHGSGACGLEANSNAMKQWINE